jgi:predicted nucleic acid-binding protein
MSPLIQYWDSGVFCSYLSKESGRWEIVRDLLNEGRAGRLEIITSSFACVEVLKIKGHNPITEAQERELITFFEYPFIKFVDASRPVCEAARRHVWRDRMKPKDAIHLACAMVIHKHRPLDGLFSWDSDFTGLSGTAGIPFPITRPFMHQPLLQNFPTCDDEPEDNEEDEDPATAAEAEAERNAPD